MLSGIALADPPQKFPSILLHRVPIEAIEDLNLSDRDQIRSMVWNKLLELYPRLAEMTAEQALRSVEVNIDLDWYDSEWAAGVNVWLPQAKVGMASTRLVDFNLGEDSAENPWQAHESEGHWFPMSSQADKGPARTLAGILKQTIVWTEGDQPEDLAAEMMSVVEATVGATQIAMTEPVLLTHLGSGDPELAMVFHFPWAERDPAEAEAATSMLLAQRAADLERLRHQVRDAEAALVLHSEADKRRATETEKLAADQQALEIARARFRQEVVEVVQDMVPDFSEGARIRVVEAVRFLEGSGAPEYARNVLSSQLGSAVSGVLHAE